MKFESFTLKPERGHDPLYIWTLLIWHEQKNRKSLEFFLFKLSMNIKKNTSMSRLIPALFW